MLPNSASTEPLEALTYAFLGASPYRRCQMPQEKAAEHDHCSRWLTPVNAIENVRGGVCAGAADMTERQYDWVDDLLFQENAECQEMLVEAAFRREAIWKIMSMSKILQ